MNTNQAPAKEEALVLQRRQHRSKTEGVESKACFYRPVGDRSEGIEVNPKGLQRILARASIESLPMEYRTPGSGGWIPFIAPDQQEANERRANASRPGYVLAAAVAKSRRIQRWACVAAGVGAVSIVVSAFMNVGSNHDAPPAAVASQEVSERPASAPAVPRAAEFRTVSDVAMAQVARAPAAISAGSEAESSRATGHSPISPKVPSGSLQPTADAGHPPASVGSATASVSETEADPSDPFDSPLGDSTFEPEQEEEKLDEPEIEVPAARPAVAKEQTVRPKPDPSEVLEQKAAVRQAVTAWLRARQTILILCEDCQGRGVINKPVVGRNGLVTVKIDHAACAGIGAIFRPKALLDLQRSYLDDATSFPGLADTIPTECEVREVLRSKSTSPGQKRAWLKEALGRIVGKAEVTKIEFEDDDLILAKVTTNVAPRTTRWFRLGKRWYLASSEDLERALAERPPSGAPPTVDPQNRRISPKPADRPGRLVEPAAPDNWPGFQASLRPGRNTVTIRNPTSAPAIVGLRNDGRGLDLRIGAGGSRTVSVGDGTIQTFFYHTDDPSAVFQIDDIVLRGHTQFLSIARTSNGNLGVRRL